MDLLLGVLVTKDLSVFIWQLAHLLRELEVFITLSAFLMKYLFQNSGIYVASHVKALKRSLFVMLKNWKFDLNSQTWIKYNNKRKSLYKNFSNASIFIDTEIINIPCFKYRIHFRIKLYLYIFIPRFAWKRSHLEVTVFPIQIAPAETVK